MVGISVSDMEKEHSGLSVGVFRLRRVRCEVAVGQFPNGFGSDDIFFLQDDSWTTDCAVERRTSRMGNIPTVPVEKRDGSAHPIIFSGEIGFKTVSSAIGELNYTSRVICYTVRTVNGTVSDIEVYVAGVQVVRLDLDLD
jgi:hypothetical protein